MKRKKKHFFFDDTMLQSYCLFENQRFLKAETTVFLQVKKQDTLIRNCSGSQMELSTDSFGLNYSFVN